MEVFSIDKYPMRAHEFIRLDETNKPREIRRYVDEKGANSYLRINAMVGRVRHWLPKQLSGLDKIYPKTGLSFTFDGTRSNWNAHGTAYICFVVDQARLTNLVVDIDGDAVFRFSADYDLYRAGGGGWNEQSRNYAIESSKAHPDEAFVIGDIRDLASKLVRIEIGSGVNPKFAQKVRTWAELHGVEVK